MRNSLRVESSLLKNPIPPQLRAALFWQSVWDMRGKQGHSEAIVRPWRCGTET
jgi:hypothetical protein